MSDELPVAVWSGSFKLFGVDVKCHRLSDGRNIIEEDSFHKMMEAMANGSLDIGDVEVFTNFKNGAPVESSE